MDKSLDQFNYRKYFAFEFMSCKNTTLGAPNPRTGNYNIAGTLKVFRSKEARAEWVNEVNYSGRRRENVSKKYARQLHLGMSVADYQRYVLEVCE